MMEVRKGRIMSNIIPELQEVLNLLNNKEELEIEIQENLDEKRQASLNHTVRELLADEFSFVMEIEIRRSLLDN